MQDKNMALMGSM